MLQLFLHYVAYLVFIECSLDLLQVINLLLACQQPPFQLIDLQEDHAQHEMWTFFNGILPDMLTSIVACRHRGSLSDKKEDFEFL